MIRKSNLCTLSGPRGPIKFTCSCSLWHIVVIAFVVAAVIFFYDKHI